jgi:hypothetical protein
MATIHEKGSATSLAVSANDERMRKILRHAMMGRKEQLRRGGTDPSAEKHRDRLELVKTISRSNHSTVHLGNFHWWVDLCMSVCVHRVAARWWRPSLPTPT